MSIHASRHNFPDATRTSKATFIPGFEEPRILEYVLCDTYLIAFAGGCFSGITPWHVSYPLVVWRISDLRNVSLWISVNASSVMRYSQVAQSCLMYTVWYRLSTRYLDRCYEPLAFLSTFACKSQLWLFSALVRKSFHDVMDENYKWFSENASGSVISWGHKSRDCGVRIPYRRRSMNLNHFLPPPTCLLNSFFT